MRKLIVSLVATIFILCQFAISTPANSSIDTLGIAYISIENLDSIHGSGVIRVMAVRGNGVPAEGNTVVTLGSPCDETVEVASIFVNFGRIDPGQTEDGHFFDFIVPTSSCHGRYTVGATINDVAGVISGSTSFKY